MKVSINAHSSIQVDDLYFDPFKIDDKPVTVFDTITLKELDETKTLLGSKKAKYVFLTHTHYDHLSPEDLAKVANNNTTIIATPDAKAELDKSFKSNPKFFIRPNEAMELDGITVSALAAYNINKQFHKNEFGWVGYKITMKGETFAVLGDTDATPELEDLKCDVLFVPIGGTYTMNAKEAADLVNKIAPKIAIPTHYNSLVGTKDDERIFADNVDKNILVKTLI